jgi:hypothetical protein
MAKTRKVDDRVDQHEPHPHRVRLPRFITDEEIGLGDAIAQATSYFGIRPCGACGRRAAVLNRWVVFTNGGRDKRPI